MAPATYLARYASRIASLRGTGRVDDLERALEAQKSFWKFVGLATVVVFGVYLLIFLVAIFAGMLR